MTVKNFKVGQGLDLDGLVLTNGNGELLVNGNAIAVDLTGYATENYVGNAISDHNSTSGIHGVTGNVVGTTDYQDISNKKIIDTLYFSDGVTISEEGEIAVLAGSHEFQIKANFGDLSLESAANNIIFVPGVGKNVMWGSDIVATEAYVANAIANSSVDLSQSAGLFLDYNANTQALDVDVAGVANSIAGFGLTFDPSANNLAVDTNIIATKQYVDAFAEGLDVKASVLYATTNASDISNVTSVTAANYLDSFTTLGDLPNGARVLIKDIPTGPEGGQNGIYVWDSVAKTLTRADDATYNDLDMTGTLTRGAFTFVEQGENSGKGFVASNVSPFGIFWTQFSETGSFITSFANPSPFFVNDGALDIALGGGISLIANSIVANYQEIANAIAGSGITFNPINNTLEAAAGFISNVTPTFVVTNGQLDLSDTITIGSVELRDSVSNVVAASDVFGGYYSGFNQQTIASLPATTKVADILVTIQDDFGSSRTSKLTAVFTGGESPTWTEYGIVHSVVSGYSPIDATISCIQSPLGNFLAAFVSYPGNYSVDGVVTLLK